jgi:hypothetical protein
MDELPVSCERSGLGSDAIERQRELWSRLGDVLVEGRELEEGYALKLPAARLVEAAELMDIERRCCKFLKLSLEAVAAEPYVWLTLTGPPGTKAVLATELASLLSSTRRNR